MASKTKDTEPASKTVVVGNFTFDLGLPVPQVTRGASGSKDGERLAAMPVGASYLEPVTVPETIKDADERAKAFKESARSATNRISGLTRRFSKKNPEYQFALRTVSDDISGHGVRVYRVAATETNGTGESGATATA